MTTCKIIFTPTNKEQKNYHALATISAFNLKLCLMVFLKNLPRECISGSPFGAHTDFFKTTLRIFLCLYQ